MKYNAYDELMNYFYFEFNVYIVLTIIILVGVIREFQRYSNIKKGTYSNINRGTRLELLYSLLALIGLSNGMFFQGVMTDTPMESGYQWVDRTVYLFVFAIILVCCQTIITVLGDKKNR